MVLTLLRTIRLHQWAKNLLVFLPAMMAHTLWISFDVLCDLFFAFFAFSFSASAVYILNDFIDIEADRNHPTKKNRPIASGAVSTKTAFILLVFLLIASFFLAFQLPDKFLVLLIAYLTCTTLYTLFLKKIALVDIITLASLYTLRIMAGGAATSNIVSEWSMAFSIFFFLSLALAKRYAELRAIKKLEGNECKGRGYTIEDLPIVLNFGISSGYLSVLVFALYLNSIKVIHLYDRPRLLWYACPVLLFWISRIWLLCYRGKMSEDPVAFALKDIVSYLVGIVGLSVFILAL